MLELPGPPAVLRVLTMAPVLALGACGPGRGADRGAVVLYQRAEASPRGIQWSDVEVIAGGDTVWAAFPSLAVFEDAVGILHYDSRHSAGPRRVMDAYLSIGAPDALQEHRMTSVPTSWPDVPGDPEHAPVQRNFGDYITLAADGARGMATWTDGRTGAPRTMARSFTVTAQ